MNQANTYFFDELPTNHHLPNLKKLELEETYNGLFHNNLPTHACQIILHKIFIMTNDYPCYDSEGLITSAAMECSIIDQKLYFTLVPYQPKAAAFIDNNVDFVIHLLAELDLCLRIYIL